MKVYCEHGVFALSEEHDLVTKSDTVAAISILSPIDVVRLNLLC